MVGEANILNKFSKIRLEEIRGMRAPFLNVGWNRQFLMMKEFGFQYDSSIIAPLAIHHFGPILWILKCLTIVQVNSFCPSIAVEERSDYT